MSEIKKVEEIEIEQETTASELSERDLEEVAGGVVHSTPRPPIRPMPPGKAV